MKGWKKIKREEAFSKKVKQLSNAWFDYNDLRCLWDKDLGFAEKWKPQLYSLQRDAAAALIFSYSNRHPGYGHKAIRKNGQLVISPQIIARAFYIRYFMLLIQACGDKLAQVVRCALGITEWTTIDRKIPAGIKSVKATEKNTHIITLLTHLQLNLNKQTCQSKNIAILHNLIEEYLKNESVKTILAQANALKHRWMIFYQGEGLHPIKPSIKEIIGPQGKVGERLPIGGYTIGKDLAEEIKSCLKVNNLFVQMATGIHNLFFQ